MSSNKTLRSAAKNKNDEFYTQLEDIEKEILGGGYDLKQFENKTVFCNCDDPYESNFTKFFIYNFNYLKLKRLICTCFKGSMIAIKGNLFKTILPQQQGYVLDISEVPIKEGLTYEEVAKYINKNKLIKNLQGNGDFRSPEVIEYLRQADIVVTNPPFSLFREYISQLIEYDKKFIVWGNNNAITYKEIFSLIKDNKLWLGSICNATCNFRIPQSYEKYNKDLTESKNDGSKYGTVPAISVFTNLDIKKRHEKLVLYKTYNEEDYPKYQNYDKAININKTNEIPIDYNGIMGVPITFLNLYNPEQFKLIGLGVNGGLYELEGFTPQTDEFKEDVKRTLGTKTCMSSRAALGYYDKNGKAIIPYARILIQRIDKEDK